MIALERSQPFYSFEFEGKSFDCGSKIGFLTANISYALARPDLAGDMRELLQDALLGE